jgi:hypothetical protein
VLQMSQPVPHVAAQPEECEHLAAGRQPSAHDGTSKVGPTGRGLITDALGARDEP